MKLKTHVALFSCFIILCGCARETERESTSRAYPLKLFCKVAGKGVYKNRPGEQRQVLFTDIHLQNLSRDTFFLWFPFTSFFNQIVFDPENVTTVGFCCDENHLERVYLLPNQQTVFHTMIASDSIPRKFRAGFAIVDDKDIHNEMPTKFDSLVMVSKTNSQKIVWSDWVESTANSEIIDSMYNYSYRFSVLDASKGVIYSSRDK